MKYFPIFIGIIFIGFSSCKVATSTKYYPTEAFSKKNVPAIPNYQDMENWAAHPEKVDPADLIPNDAPKGTVNNQAHAKVDVFFVYPTIYDGTKKYHTTWNADVKDAALNERIDESTIQHQSSVFNGVGRIYAPRYRQAHLNVYYETASSKDSAQALDLAYEDVKAAFLYYLRNYNEGRPIVIAAHSQGTMHAGRLLSEFFEGQKLQEQLVAAYLVGMPIPKTLYTTIALCDTPKQIGCYCTWNAYARDHYPKYWDRGLKYAAVTNPVNWLSDETYASYEENKGGVSRKFDYKPNLSDAQIKDGMVWINTPKIAGAGLLRIKRWHVAEYNLFYFNIRENVADRVAAFLDHKK